MSWGRSIPRSRARGWVRHVRLPVEVVVRDPGTRRGAPARDAPREPGHHQVVAHETPPPGRAPSGPRCACLGPRWLPPVLAGPARSGRTPPRRPAGRARTGRGRRRPRSPSRRPARRKGRPRGRRRRGSPSGPGATSGPAGSRRCSTPRRPRRSCSGARRGAARRRRTARAAVRATRPHRSPAGLRGRARRGSGGWRTTRRPRRERGTSPGSIAVRSRSWPRRPERRRGRGPAGARSRRC